MPDSLVDLTRLGRERWHGQHGDAHLRVAPDVWDTMRQAAPPKPHPLYGTDVARHLLGIPVVADQDLPPGAWRLVGNTDREVRQEGTTHTTIEEADRA